jgi:hypothetical protein
MRSFSLFAMKVIAVHTTTYYIAGIISFHTILGQYVNGVKELAWYFKPMSTFGPWVLPAELFRGVILAAAWYPMRKRFHELGTLYGGLAIAGIYLLVGQFGCPGTAPGAIEGFVYTRLPVDFQFAVLPEIIGQGLALGLLVNWWDSRTQMIRGY